MPTVSRLFLKREMSKDVLRPTRSKETNSGPFSGYILLIFEERNHTKPSQDLFLVIVCVYSEKLPDFCLFSVDLWIVSFQMFAINIVP